MSNQNKKKMAQKPTTILEILPGRKSFGGKMKNSCFILFAMLVYVASAQSALVENSPWEHTNPEIMSPVPVFTPGSAPVTFGPGGSFVRERENYGYDPRFKPNKVTFSHDNRPFILVGLYPYYTYELGYSLNEDPTSNTITLPRRAWMDTAYIQTLDENGNWIVINLEEIYGSDVGYGSYLDFQPYMGIFENNDRVVFDADGGIYFVSYGRADTGVAYTNYVSKLFYSADSSPENFKGYYLPRGLYPEVADSFNSDRKVTLLATSNYTINTISVKRDYVGELAFTESVVLSNPDSNSQFGPLHTGIVNPAVTIGNITHAVYLDIFNPIGNETAQYYNWYNSKTGEIGSPVLLGSTVSGSNNPDSHNGPAITVDSENTLHVVLGAHNTPMKYTYSTDGGKTWSAATQLVDSGTYPSLVTAPDGTLHLVFRRIEDNQWKLWYFRKPLGGAWQDMGKLIQPARENYAIYYHKLTIDRIGRLFLFYTYFTMEMSSAEISEYTAKWPYDPYPVNGEDEVNSNFAHDPVILMSDTGGNTWHLATTQDFINGITDLEAYYSFDANSTADVSGKGRDMTGTVGGYTAGVSSKAAQFTGASNISTLFNQNTIFTKGAFSVSCWINPASVANSTFVGASQSNTGFDMNIESGTYRVNLYATTGVQSINSAVSASANNWTNVAVSFAPAGAADGSGNYTGTAKVYVDGVLKANVPNVKYKPSTGSLAIAAKAGGSSKFTGLIDETAVYSYVLDDNKISKLANLRCSPKAVYSIAQLQGDINDDGTVNYEDLLYLAENWLVN